ncbi:hypothetical protein [Streptomyces sp. NPDC088141]|uniref:hypothetical protein n=1 Tax=Streptomyces sp. NPDC088141 TaxID=3155179 RepID=UPI003449A9E8
MFRRKRAIRELREAQRESGEMLQKLWQEPWSDEPDSPDGAPEAATKPAASAPVVDDFLPKDLRVPGRDEFAGLMTRHNEPLIVNGEIRECSECGAYRDWVVLSTRDEIRLHCPAGHTSVEPGLDTAWFNRNSGPMDHHHASLEDALKYLGH